MTLGSVTLMQTQGIVGLASILVTTFGAVAAMTYVKRSRWASIVAAGLSLQAVGQLAGQVMIPVLVLAQSSDAADFSRESLGLSVFALIARITVVVGITGMLAEVSRAKRKTEVSSSDTRVPKD